MVGLWCVQILAVMRLEMKKTFFAKRGLWVYLLAFAPVVLYLVHSINNPRERQRLTDIATEHRVSTQALNAIERGFTHDQVLEKLGEPYDQDSHTDRRGGREHEYSSLWYTDGETKVRLFMYDGEVRGIRRRTVDNLVRSQTMFATSFQFYFLRLAIFFGCVGIFVNLFRGEMLDKSLHFYLLTPMRREILLIGKYLAGLFATVIIFTSSTALQWFAMLWQFKADALSDFFTGPGWPQLWAYLGVTALACVGYGSIFLAIGLLFKNPIVPAAIILLWESINPFLPAALKKISMIFYLQSLSPVDAARDGNMPVVFSLLVSPTEPATPALAITGILLLTLGVLVGASVLARRLEINYSTD